MMKYKSEAKQIVEGRRRREKIKGWFSLHSSGFGKDIAHDLDFRPNHTFVVLNEMVDKGILTRSKRYYAATGYPSLYYSLPDQPDSKPGHGNIKDPDLNNFFRFCSLLTEEEALANKANVWPYKSEAVNKKKWYSKGKTWWERRGIYNEQN